MAQDQVDEIKKRTDIVELIGEHVSLKKAGRNFKALCPFHSEKTPSFMISPELQIYKCFGCGAGGDVYSFVQEYEKIDFPQALKILADRAGIKLQRITGDKTFALRERIYQANFLAAEFYHYLLTRHEIGKNALSYLRRQRGLSEEAISVFKLGFAPSRKEALTSFLSKKKGFDIDILVKAGLTIMKQNGAYDRFYNRVIFPLYSHHGYVVGFAGRIVPESQTNAPKYINIPESPVYKKGENLYGLHITKQEIKEEGTAVVVEGELDAISSWQAKARNTVAIKGSSLTEEQVALLARFTDTLILALDADLAGDAASRRGIEIAQDKGMTVKVVKLSGAKDPDEAARENPEGWRKTIANAVGVYDFIIGSVFSRYDPKTPFGKAKIGRELAPILARIGDEIVRAHYVGEVAARLGVSQEAVFGEVAKRVGLSGDGRSKVSLEEENEKKGRTRRQLLEDYLLTVALHLDKEAVLGLAKHIKTNPAARLIVEFKKFTKSGKFNLASFSKKLPPELLEYFGQLMLIDLGELTTQLDRLEAEIKNGERSLEAMTLREKLVKISAEIGQLEEKGQSKKVRELEEKFAKFSAKLAQLEEG